MRTIQFLAARSSKRRLLTIWDRKSSEFAELTLKTSFFKNVFRLFFNKLLSIIMQPWPFFQSSAVVFTWSLKFFKYNNKVFPTQVSAVIFIHQDVHYSTTNSDPSFGWLWKVTSFFLGWVTILYLRLSSLFTPKSRVLNLQVSSVSTTEVYSLWDITLKERFT